MYADEDEFEDWPTSQPTTPSRRHQSDFDEDVIDYPAPEESSHGFATQTSFDAYFRYASKPSRTSSNVFSALVPPLTLEEYTGVLKKLRDDPRDQEHVLWRDEATRRACFRRYGMELDEGFNLMMYGCGSKREFLNAFAQHLSRTGGHVVVANGFHPSFTFRDLLSSIEHVPGVLDASPSAPAPASANAGTSLDAQTQRIHAFFSAPTAPRLFLILHNIDGPVFRAPKHRAALALLALTPRIHIVASVDHIAAPTRWSLSELFARKPDPPLSPFPSAPSTSTSSGVKQAADPVPRRGFAWLWHDLTTLAPYDFELAYADPTSISGAAALRGTRPPAVSAAVAAAAGVGGAPGAALVTEIAARHVLASVTQKAKKLFVLLGAKQLEVMDDGAAADAADKDKGGAKAKEAPGEGAYDYDRLFGAARDNFIATSDTALRALLGEFRDHGLVVTVAAAQGGAEAMWIPMRRDALLKVVGDLKAEGL